MRVPIKLQVARVQVPRSQAHVMSVKLQVDGHAEQKLLIRRDASRCVEMRSGGHLT